MATGWWTPTPSGPRSRTCVDTAASWSRGALAVAAIKQYVARQDPGQPMRRLCAPHEFDRRASSPTRRGGRGTRALFAVTIPRSAAAPPLCELIGTLPGGARNVTSQSASATRGRRTCRRLTTHGKANGAHRRQFHPARIGALDLTHDEWTRAVRHMVAARRPWRIRAAARFVFPERHCDLMKCLSQMSRNGHLAFHYRKQGPIRAHYGGPEVRQRRKRSSNFMTRSVTAR